MRILIVGAGLTGSACARLIAELGHEVDVHEKSDHPGGMLKDIRVNGFFVSEYGPHILHTDNDKVYKFVKRISRWKQFSHSVLAITDNFGKVPYPINYETMYKVNGYVVSKEAIEEFMKTFSTMKPSFRQVMLSQIGPRLYDALIKPYSEKQWGREDSLIPESVAGRIPVRMSEKNKFFLDKYVMLPVNGFSAFIHDLLDHENITVHLSSEIKADEFNFDPYEATVFSGELRFDKAQYQLPYRSIDFVKMEKLTLESAVENDCRSVTNYTRFTDYAKLYGSGGKYIIGELPKLRDEDDYPMYPVMSEKNLKLRKVIQYHIASFNRGYTLFTGRLGEYEYLNMDTCIEHAFEVEEHIKEIDKIKRRLSQ